MQRRCCHPPPPSHFPSLGYVGISVVRHLYKHTTAPSHGKTKKPSSPFPIAKNKKKRTKERRGEKTPIHLDPSVFLFTFVKQSQKRMGAKRGGDRERDEGKDWFIVQTSWWNNRWRERTKNHQSKLAKVKIIMLLFFFFPLFNQSIVGIIIILYGELPYPVFLHWLL